MTENGDILETSGMVYIEAKANGEKCEIAKSASVLVGFPNVKNAKDNKLYQGQVNQRQVQWKSENTVHSIEYGVSLISLGHKKLLALDFIGLGNIFTNHLRKNIEFPVDALEAGVCGIVRVQFKIDSKGNVTAVSLVDEGLYPSIDKHVIEVVSSSPTLFPAYKKDKKALKHYYTATFLFSSGKCKRGHKRYAIDKWENQNWLIKNPIPSEPDSLELSDVKNISTVIYTTSKLGWLNVDKLNRLPGKKVNMEISFKPAYNVDFKIILVNYGSVVIGQQRKDSFVFSKMPQGQKGVIIGLKYDKGKIYLAKSQILINNTTIKDIEFKEVTVSQLKAELTELK